MKKYILLISALTFFSSCNGTNKTVSKTSKAIQKTEPVVSEKIKVIEEIEEPNTTNETQKEIIEQDVISSEIEEETIEEIAKPIKEFNHNLWNDLLQKHVSSQGNVNYKGFKSDYTILQKYIASLGENTPTKNWSKEEKLAYWMNAYNALTVDLIVRNYPLKSIKNIDNPWKQRLWKLGDKNYNLEEIEHEILRKMKEPRIHFGIVCASYSCPKLLNEAFEASTVNVQLTKVTKDFLADNNRNEISQNSIKISKIFSWFSKDFKQDGSLIDFLNKYSEIAISQNAKKSFKDYDWNLNE